MRSYDLDARRAYIQVLPPVLRLPVIVAFAAVFTKGLNYVTAALSNLVHLGRYHLNITGQVIYLEHYLNDLLDTSARRIYIDDASPILPPFLFRTSENRPYILRKNSEVPPTYWLSEREYTEAASFIVFVPSGLMQDQSLRLLRAAIDRYRPAGRFYEIQVIP